MTSRCLAGIQSSSCFGGRLGWWDNENDNQGCTPTPTPEKEANLLRSRIPRKGFVPS